MKIFKIKSDIDSNGLYPIPNNLVNKMMFQYPYYGTSDYDKLMIRKINTIIAMFGEKYNFYSVGMMGHDTMTIFTYEKMGACIPIEHHCQFGLFDLYGDILIEIECEADYLKRDRYLKLNRIYESN